VCLRTPSPISDGASAMQPLFTRRKATHHTVIHPYASSSLCSCAALLDYIFLRSPSPFQKAPPQCSPSLRGARPHAPYDYTPKRIVFSLLVCSSGGFYLRSPAPIPDDASAMQPVATRCKAERKPRIIHPKQIGFSLLVCSSSGCDIQTYACSYFRRCFCNAAPRYEV